MDKIKAAQTLLMRLEGSRVMKRLVAVFGHMLALHYCLWWRWAYLEYVTVFLKNKEL